MDPNAPNWEHGLEPAALSDIGLRRGNNQDALATVIASSQEKFLQRGHLFLVADGMGAHAAGELASKLAADVVPLTYYKLLDRSPPEALVAAIQDANSQIHNRGMASDDFRGMGTTVSALAILPEGAWVSHVGDSRVYRVRANQIEQLTFDHSLVWELRAAGHVSPEDAPSYIPKNIITRSLGPNPEVQIDLEGPLPIQPGDVFLLCSDGLSGQVGDHEIGKIVSALPPEEAVRALVDLANLRGGPDNVTVIVVRVARPPAARGDTEPSAAPPSRRGGFPLPVALWVTAGVLALLAGGAMFYGETTAGLACLGGAAVAGLIALLRAHGASGEPRGFRPMGKGPYTSTDATVDGPFVEQLSQTVGQLRDAAAGADWTIDWDRFREHESRAVAATGRGEFAEAVRDYCRAMVFMMTELRSQPDRRKLAEGGSDSFSESF